MKRFSQGPYIDSLSASEGVFTTAQAERFGISRGALAKACASGRIVRLAQGVYRSAAATSSPWDEVAAAWKLTAPSKMLHERMNRDSWEGFAIGGTTAASLNGIGDFYLTPIRMYTPKRFKTRNSEVHASVRRIDWEDVGFEYGFAVTRIERTIVDLILDDEDLSLVHDAYCDALKKGFDCMRLRLIVEGFTGAKARKIHRALEEVGPNSV